MIGRGLLYTWVMLALAFCAAGAARAQDFNFSYINNGVSVMGILNSTAQGNGRYLINNITNGTRGGNGISLLAPSAFGGNDNILIFPANPAYFDDAGFSYTSAGSNYNVFFNSIEYTQFSNVGSPRDTPASNLMVEAAGAPAPIPGGGLLSFLALGLTGLAWRRKAIVVRGCQVLACFATKPSAKPA